MTTKTTLLLTLCIASLVGLLAAIAVFVGPAKANKDPVTPQQLKAYDDALMEQVKIGDLLFHGDAATAKKMNVVLSNTGMACAMCHPFASDTHPQAFPKFQVSMNKFATLRDMINWSIGGLFEPGFTSGCSGLLSRRRSAWRCPVSSITPTILAPPWG